MFDRRGLAVLILCAWIAALGWHARDHFFSSAGSRLALGVRTLPPGVAYYAVYRDEIRAGWGQTEIDTLPGASGFRVRERLVIEVPGLAPGGLERTVVEYLDAGLDLDSLTYTSVVGSDTTHLSVVVSGDTVARVHGGGEGEPRAIDLAGPVTTQAGWRLRLAASDGVEAGERFELDVLDPASAVRRSQELTVLEQRTVAFPDSADTDSISGEWVAVRADTVTAWNIELTVGEAGRTVWVDEDGRLVDGQIAGGYSVERTAFELAFFTRPGIGRGPVANPAEPDTASQGEQE